MRARLARGLAGQPLTAALWTATQDAAWWPARRVGPTGWSCVHGWLWLALCVVVVWQVVTFLKSLVPVAVQPGVRRMVQRASL